MQKDMKLVVKNFFDSVYEYTKKMSALYVDEMAKAQLADANSKLHSVQKQIEKIQASTDTQEMYRMACDLTAFNIREQVFMKPGSQNNNAYWAFIGVIRGITNFYKSYNPYNKNVALDKLLAKWYYCVSDSLFKDFVYALYPGYYAKKAIENQK